MVGSGDLGGSDDAASKEINGDLLILGAQVGPSAVFSKSISKYGNIFTELT